MRAPLLWSTGGCPSGLWSSTALPAPPPAALSPQEAAERLNSVLPVKFIISSRTDAGVHALSNAAHLDVQRRSGQPPFSPEVLTQALNTHLRHPAIRCAALCSPPLPHCIGQKGLCVWRGVTCGGLIPLLCLPLLPQGPAGLPCAQ